MMGCPQPSRIRSPSIPQLFQSILEALTVLSNSAVVRGSLSPPTPFSRAVIWAKAKRVWVSGIFGEVAKNVLHIDIDQLANNAIKAIGRMGS